MGNELINGWQVENGVNSRPITRKAFAIWLMILSLFIFGCQQQNVSSRVLTEADEAIYLRSIELMGFNNFEKGLACSRKLNQPIFLMFNGYRCVSTRPFEEKVAPDLKVKEFLSQHFVPIILYVDDRAKLTPDKVDSVIINDKQFGIETVGHLK